MSNGSCSNKTALSDIAGFVVKRVENNYNNKPESKSYLPHDTILEPEYESNLTY
jgi:hypothetical protein